MTITREEEEAKAKEEQLREINRKNELNDVKKIMKTEQGRRFIYRILEQTGMFTTSFTGNSATYFKEGERNIGLWLQKEIDVECMEEGFTMLREYKAKVDEENRLMEEKNKTEEGEE